MKLFFRTVATKIMLITIAALLVPFTGIVGAQGMAIRDRHRARFDRAGAVPKSNISFNGKHQRVSNESSLDQVPVECDAAAGRLDDAVIETRRIEGAYLIIIARLGAGEPSRLNQIRLANVEEYVLRRGSDLKYVLAQGTRVKGLGRIELYIGGRLARVMPLQKNAKGYCLPRREGW